MSTTRIALVAGARGGLGRAVVPALRAAGFEVVEAGREAGDPSAVRPLIERVVSEVGVPDVVVNTIGAHALGDYSTVTPSGLTDLMNVNLGTAWWLTQAVAPHMLARGTGTIIHTGARAGVSPFAGAAAYGVTKAALAHLGRILSEELRPIRVHVVLPELIATETNKAILPPAVLSRAATPESIAAVITSLATTPTPEVLIPAYNA